MSELKTSKVKNIQSLGNKGAYYVWEVELENGDNAELFKKNNIINKAWAIKTAALCYAGHWNNDGPTQSPERISEDVLALAKLYKISLDEWVKE